MALIINIEIQLEWDDIYREGVETTLEKAVNAILNNNSKLPETVKKIMAEHTAKRGTRRIN